MKFLFVGLGSISAKHIRDLTSVASERNCVCEITVLRRALSNIPDDLQAYNIKQITELDETIYDAAFVTNPTNLHYNALEQLKDKTKFYFIEKPIFESTKYDFAKAGISENNAYVACPMRHSATYKKLKEIADSNRIFNARIICSSYLPEWRPNIDYRKNYSAVKALGGGVTLDLIHEIDYMTGLFGKPGQVMNIHGKFSDLEIDSDDLSVYVAKYDDKICEVHLDYFGRKYQRKCELFTSQGSYTADFKTETIELPDGSVIKCDNGGKTNLYRETKYFFDFITGKALNNLNPPQLAFDVLRIALGESHE